ncbi:hypothetical protein MBT84_06120 [Streptomyces sp. MBT84]|nr:hypothetical protein [Streptomyces sp. MBT84]
MVDGFGELLGLATKMLRHYPEIGAEELAFHLVEARARNPLEVTGRLGECAHWRGGVRGCT